MANLQEIAASASVNLLSVLAFLLGFAFLRLQPVNDRVYFPKWYKKGTRGSPKSYGNLVKKFVNLDIRTYLKFWIWMPEALKMPESKLIDHAGLDSVGSSTPKPLMKKKFAKSVVQGVLPGIALKLFTASLPTILTAMSIVEGDTSLSALERRTAGKYHLFILVNIFFGSIITGTAFQQLYKFLHQAPSEIPKTVGVAIPMKATFFITYIMVDGWSSIAAEIIRFVPLILFHLKNTFLVKTEDDKEHAMAPGSLNFSTTEPRIQLYFLLGLVYSVITPLILPFIIVFFGFSYMIYRHQVINVYDQNYESGATFWPDVHRRVIIGLIMSQVLLMGLLSTMSAAKSTPLLLVLPIFTIGFHRFCKGRFEPAFAKFPLEEAMMKDALDKETEPKVKLKEYLQNAYVHPVFKDAEFDRPVALNDEENDPLVSTKRSKSSRRSSRGSFDGFGFDFVDVVDELISYFPSTKPLD